jgi:hypothetical protein
MSKMKGLQQALDKSVGKAPSENPVPVKAAAEPATKSKSSGREGKELTGAWLHPDFGMSLRMVQLRKRKDAQGKKVFLEDLIAEALNDLFVKYDVPTVRHE